MSATGGLVHEATYFHKRLAHKWGDEYFGLVVVFLVFSLPRSAFQCVRGAHSTFRHQVVAPPPMDLVKVESNLSLEDDHGR